MNLYLLSQDINNDYDTYDSCVVCAENEDVAKTIHPSKLYPDWDYEYEDWEYGTWAKSPNDVKCKLIGVADKSLPGGVVLASFNAG